ncbi:hypothetical protein SUNI508_13109 [Seiridium unicorne]|uniref:Uncharacterized protein n=1 Tax=Seiridium unicorne TaxID=138068 RepID=A0ABR2VFA1_9PEZI
MSYELSDFSSDVIHGLDSRQQNILTLSLDGPLDNFDFNALKSPYAEFPGINETMAGSSNGGLSSSGWWTCQPGKREPRCPLEINFAMLKQKSRCSTPQLPVPLIPKIELTRSLTWKTCSNAPKAAAPPRSQQEADSAGSTTNSMNDKGKSIAEYGRASSPEQSSIQSVPGNGLDQEAVADNDKEHVPATEKLGDQIENLSKQVAMLKEENWKLKKENSQQAEQVRKLSTAIRAFI